LGNIDRAVKELVANHGYSESRLGGAKPVEHGGGAEGPAGRITLWSLSRKLFRMPSVSMATRHAVGV